ncbi:Zinc finger protein Pegasus [Merluccius polli]|uniref:Zinc finger protein Pegasus n=1 Tax=Merluccius polli TaxID=89951 RepID=A0AA47NZ37_MERPO|nr:Zinc finger protein Pegasus [Merluccius polli]
MEDLKAESVDFVKEFQEYLTQQTQHVNMISGSVCGENNPGDSFQAVPTASDQGGLDPPSVEVSLSLEDGAELQMDGLERTSDGKYKCSYCNYANKGMARLIEHIRIHTGEKPHRCQLCPFASAYERHLEAHMRSHTGEKPYKCDLCAFCCSDRSNLSHHRRRRHKLLPMRGVRSPFTNKRMLSVLQKRASSLGFGRRLLGNYGGPPPSMLGPRADYAGGPGHDVRPHLSIGVSGEYNKTAPGVIKPHESSSSNGGGSRSANGLPAADNPLDQLSTLAGRLANLPPRPQSPCSLDRLSCEDDVKPILIQQASGPPLAVSVNGSQTAPSPKEEESDGRRSYGLDGEAAQGFDRSARTLYPTGVGQPSAPPPATPPQDQPASHTCPHCDIQFSDNILYTIHMGCHGYENPFQCNICGSMCRDKYDFACHYARGHHHK